jgi:hypothetical protein
MVSVPFTGPYYPPDAAAKGKTPSPPSDVFVALKRTLGRLGAWPWDPPSYDRSFSNAFAHGGGNGPGIAGIQAWAKIEPASGWIGESTWNFLRSVRVQQGRPHAGEPAMDEYAAQLIRDAAKKPPAPPAGKLTRKAFPSPNYSSRGGATVRLIVIHTAEGATTIESLGSYFANSSVDASSHTGIDDKLGVVGEYVKRGNKAWTAANANPVAVQTELCAFAKWSSAEWAKHPNMLENCSRWIAEEAVAFGLPITKLSASAAQGSGRGVCQHNDLGSWGGGHWDCGGSFPIDDVLKRAKELT